MFSEELSTGLNRGKYKPSVPAIITRNAMTLDNIMDELRAVIKSQKEYGECSMMCSRETLLHFLDCI